MAKIWPLSRESWDQKGALTPIITDTAADGRLIPKVRVIEPGLGDRKSAGLRYLLLHGVIEDVTEFGIGRTFGALPLGIGKSTADPVELLKECLGLKITVRRTAGANEKIVYYNQVPLTLLTPWAPVLTKGGIFNANEVCNNVECIPLDIPQQFRPVYLTITELSDAGCYCIPRPILDFRAENALALNLLFELEVDGDLDGLGLRRSIPGEPSSIVTFMIHLGLFKRRKNKIYSPEYCKKKLDRMGLVFGLGGVGGVSIHVRLTGKMSKTMAAQLGLRKVLCYPLMLVNNHLNRLLWRNQCSIKSVSAVFQPSAPKEFKLYNDIIIDNVGGVII
uniref:Matrix protein n=1 Tax=Niviventer confucianus morbillivirus TaxID=3049976 RepID=A0A9Y1Z3X7_9MONO|nr:matrix protein [Niviventer confucianus morbillivirus]